MASSAGDHFVVALRRMKSEIVAASVLTAAGAVRDLLLKANFDPSQPRVPRGNSEGGRWVRDDRRIGRTSPSNTLWPPKPAVDEPRVWLVADEAEGPPPQVPEEPPVRGHDRIVVALALARWMSALAERYGRETALGQAIQVAEMSAWLYSYWPLLEAAQDEPKTLEELRRAAETWRAGYDTHHLVERATAKNASERLRVEQPDNRLSIPRFKHWELNRWYETGNPLFGGQTPRAYARNQKWEERERVGLMGLRQVGVLKP